MAHSILITGASGYLGGTLLARLQLNELPKHKQVYALVRSKEQEEAVKSYGVQPFYLDMDNEQAVMKGITEAKISIILFLIDAVNHNRQLRLIKALAEVKSQTGLQVHFLHTTGAKIFSEHAGLPTDRPIADNDPELHDLQKMSKAPLLEVMNSARETNVIVIETAEAYGVRSYIFIPCIVYGEGEGFGNKTSIQTVAIVKAAKDLRRVYDVNPGGATWPVCHVVDNCALYVSLLKNILLGENIGHGPKGYYLASSGSVAWRDLYAAMAESLARRHAVDDNTVETADEAVLNKMGQALGCPKEFVRLQLGGSCTLQPQHGSIIGWHPQYTPEHALRFADDEVGLILANIKD